ncbi:MAG: glycosyltransferase family 4 protein [Vicinamibacterales bacterium]
MRILMLAPEPFFEPRGTPFSEYHRIKALGELGHHVDLVTYPIGRDVELPNLRIFRSLGLPFVRKVRIGPSLTKVVLDALMLLTIARRVVAQRYDVIHSHEEMGLVGVFLSKWLRIPHLYDMHSSLPQQLRNFKYSKSSTLRRVFTWAEHQMVHKSDVVITICQELQDTVAEMGVADRALLIENVMGGDVDEPPTRSPGEIRNAWGIADAAPLALYTGTFEAYQGVEMLIDAVALLVKQRPDVRVLVVGGEPEQVEQTRARAATSGAAAAMIFTGQQPAKEIPGFVQAADLLVSPRIRGTNTPLKIYSYLRSGKPIVATNLLTHTQVLTPEIAVLVDPKPQPFAAAILELLEDPQRRAQLSSAARAVAAEKYSRDAYLKRTALAYERLQGARGAQGAQSAQGAAKEIGTS